MGAMEDFDALQRYISRLHDAGKLNEDFLYELNMLQSHHLSGSGIQNDPTCAATPGVVRQMYFDSIRLLREFDPVICSQFENSRRSERPRG